MKKKYVFDFFNLAISFLICRWFFMEYLYFQFISIFGFPTGGSDFWRPLFIILILTLFLFTFLRASYTHRLDTRLIRISYFLYCLILVYSLLFKNLGIQGVNFNLVEFIKDSLLIDSTIPLLNIIIFIPIGGLFKFNFKTVMRFIFFITIIETSQYVFHLGFFDIGDIFTNTIGFIIGNNIHDSRLGKKIIHYIK